MSVICRYQWSVSCTHSEQRKPITEETEQYVVFCYQLFKTSSGHACCSSSTMLCDAHLTTDSKQRPGQKGFCFSVDEVIRVLSHCGETLKETHSLQSWKSWYSLLYLIHDFLWPLKDLLKNLLHTLIYMYTVIMSIESLDFLSSKRSFSVIVHCCFSCVSAVKWRILIK